MEDLASKVKQMTRRISRKGSYDLAIGETKFKLRALSPEGIIVPALDRDASNSAVDFAFSTPGSLEGRNKPNVVLTISSKNGIKVADRKGRDMISYKIHQVGYCNVDKRYPEVFVFMGASIADGDGIRCHVFLCEDAQKAKAICMTMANAFQSSYEQWQRNKEMLDNYKMTHAVNINIRRKSADDLQISSTPPHLQRHVRRSSDFVTTTPIAPTPAHLQRHVRRSSDYAVAPKIAPPAHLQRHVRRSSDFLPIPSANRHDVLRSSDNTIRENSPIDTFDFERERTYSILSTSQENGTRALLRHGSHDWTAIEQDDTIRQMMLGDVIENDVFQDDAS